MAIPVALAVAAECITAATMIIGMAGSTAVVVGEIGESVQLSKKQSKYPTKGRSFRGGSKGDRDKWFGHNEKEFHKWFERVGKREYNNFKDIDSKAVCDEMYDIWKELGKPFPK